jgi:hypothetical protein
MVIQKLLWVFGAGFFLVVVFNIRNLSSIFYSEAWKRYLGWLLIAPVFLTGVMFGGIISILITGFLMFKSIREFTLMEKLPIKFYIVLLFNGLLSILISILSPENMLLLPYIYIVATAGVAIVTKTPQNMMHKVYIVLFGCVWICYSISHMFLFRTIEDGQGLLVLVGSLDSSDVLFVIGGITGTSCMMKNVVKTLQKTVPYPVINITYKSKSGIITCENNLHNQLEILHLQKYRRVHFFCFIMGGYVLSRVLEKQPIPNLGRVILDRSPFQEDVSIEAQNFFSRNSGAKSDSGDSLTGEHGGETSMFSHKLRRTLLTMSQVSFQVVHK